MVNMLTNREINMKMYRFRIDIRGMLLIFRHILVFILNSL